MKFFLTVVTLGFLIACNDKEEDTGTDTAQVDDSGDSIEE